MKISRPTKTVFWISVILGVLGILGYFAVAALAPYAFWLVTAGFVLLVLGNIVKGL